MKARAHAIVVCPLWDDLYARNSMFPPADIRAGRCIGCSKQCAVNPSGAKAIRDRDADVCCLDCEKRYDADINHALIES